MAYKSKDKQREANRAASKRYRESKQGMTETEASVIPEQAESVIPHWAKPDCQCRHCQTARTNKSKNVINHGPYKPYKPASQLAENEVNRVSLPGDPDYAPTIQATEVMAYKAESLPACVPKILHARYAREPDYAKVIDKLLNHSLDELHLQAVWIPVWRYTAGPAAPVAASPVAEKDKRQNKGAGGRG